MSSQKKPALQVKHEAAVAAAKRAAIRAFLEHYDNLTDDVCEVLEVSVERAVQAYLEARVE